jgi:hypothetical protein
MLSLTDRHARVMKPREARLNRSLWERGVDGTLSRIDSYIGTDKNTNDPNLKRILETLETKADRCKDTYIHAHVN